MHQQKFHSFVRLPGPVDSAAIRSTLNLFFRLCLVAWVAIYVQNGVAESQYVGPSINVDISQDSGRNDVIAPGCHHWRFGQSKTANFKIGDLTFVLESLDPSQPISVLWWKKGFDFPAAIASDGASVSSSNGFGLQLRIHGLAPGKHSIASFHNYLSAKDVGVLHFAIDDTEVIANFRPSRNVLHDDDCGSLWSEFEVVDGRAPTFTWRASKDPQSATEIATTILNGFSLDVQDPRQQASKPIPSDGDEHVEESPELRWTATANSHAQRIYFGTDASQIANANIHSDEYLGQLSSKTCSMDLTKHARWQTLGDRSELRSNSATTARSDSATTARSNSATAASQPIRGSELDPFETYYWRVDSIRAGQTEPSSVGKIWSFRVRRLAFPGAEGYGRFAQGGREGRAIQVTNLNDHGPGSLREAVDADGPRTVVFQVGGTIELKSKLVIRNPYITIAGHTAPGDGICIRGYTFGCMGTHDVIIRHVRIRVGDEARMTMDGTGFASTDHSIMDHCSISWSIDEAVSSRGANNITVQRCIVAEALNIADHKKYEPGKGHSFAGSISGNIGSFHHNLVAHCAGRNWSLAGGLDRGGGFAGKLDIRNNVVYNWQHRTTDGGVKALNFVNNFYIPGPATRVFHLLKPDAGSPQDPQQYYMAGNHMEGRDYDEDNWQSTCALLPKEWGTNNRLLQPFCTSGITEHTAAQAYTSVLADVGANLPRLDSMDRRILEEVQLRRTTFQGGRSGLPGIIDSQTDVGGWPTLENGPIAIDTDLDGMPDAWEKANSLDPTSSADATERRSSPFTNLERYLMSVESSNR
ncbi:MAG: hypothetical protein ABL921_18330 [Pirellula sp.]